MFIELTLVATNQTELINVANIKSIGGKGEEFGVIELLDDPNETSVFVRQNYAEIKKSLKCIDYLV